MSGAGGAALGAAARAGASGLGGELFARKLGPLPLWAWAGIAVAGGGLAYLLYKRRQGPQGGSGSALGGSGAGAGDPNIDPNTGVPWAIESAINPATGLPAYYGGPGVDSGTTAGAGGSGGPQGEPGAAPFPQPSSPTNPPPPPAAPNPPSNPVPPPAAPNPPPVSGTITPNPVPPPAAPFPQPTGGGVRQATWPRASDDYRQHRRT